MEGSISMTDQDSAQNWMNSAEYQFLHKELKVTMRDYSDAINGLYEYACSDRQHSRLAANVLLSAYNSKLYPLELQPLYESDISLLNQVLIIIRGRSTLKMEPHHAISRGPEKFGRLKDEWVELLAVDLKEDQEEKRES